jgi:drug/metabolite transporter (DMT)-like permease
VATQALVTFIAALLIGLSVQGSNATFAGIIEMSYPIFIVAFSYLLFREHHLNAGIIVGGVLIFIGVAVVYFFNR